MAICFLGKACGIEAGGPAKTSGTCPLAVPYLSAPTLCPLRRCLGLQSLLAGCQASMIGRASGAFLSPPTRHRCCSPGSLPPLHSSSAYTMFLLGFYNFPPRERLRRERRVRDQLQPQKQNKRQVKHRARREECSLGNCLYSICHHRYPGPKSTPLAELSLQVSPQATAATLAF